MSSSESCFSSSALACSPSTIKSMAAFCRLGRASSLVVLRIIGGPRGWALLLFLPDPTAQDLDRGFGLGSNLVAQVFGKHLGLLVNHGGEFQGRQHLAIHLFLQGIAFRQLRLHLAFYF